MNTHDFEQLLNWVEGRLSVAEAQKLETQLETVDNETHSLIKWLKEFQSLNQNHLLALPPDNLDEKLYNIFSKQSKTKQSPPFFQRLLTSLTFDSYQQTVVAGVRSASAQKSGRQLVYNADFADVTLDLQWLTSEKQIFLNGQIFPADETDETIYIVDLQKESKTLAIAQTDVLGKFTFPTVAPDTYDIILSGDHFEIALTGVEIHV